MIRVAKLEDVSAIVELGQKLLSNFDKTYNISNYIEDNNYIAIVSDEKTINAFLLISENASAYELEAIYVLDKYRHQGIASNLIKYFLTNYYHNQKDIFLEVSTDNEEALKLYQKFAFEIISTRPKYYQNKDAYVMKRVEYMKDVNILSIETSCDETSIAIVKNGVEVVALTILTQMDTHANFGGVVPEIASRMHTENITMVLEATLNKAHMKVSDVDAIAVTYAPGLLGSLLVGIEFAKVLSYVYDKPLIKVNHLVGHIYANKIGDHLKFPCLALIISGGHTELVKMTGDYEFEMLGETQDDAIGEAFDKVARVIGLPYPGGPNIEKLAREGKDSYKLPDTLNDGSYNFSYSGLKSSVINLVNNERQRGNEINKADLACSFQTTAVKELTRKLDIALKKTGIKNVIIAGGVSANKYLRGKVKETCDKYKAELTLPEFIYCTDNAAMIGAAAYPLYLKEDFADLDLNAKSTSNIC